MLSKFLSILSPRYRHTKQLARVVYSQIILQSRSPFFYTDLLIQDDFDGRFEILCLHGSIFLTALNEIAFSSTSYTIRRDYHRMSQAYFDAMFENLEFALREMGVGDLGVPRRIRKYMSGFQGRSLSYAKALKQKDNSEGDLVSVIMRNVYHATPEVLPEIPQKLAGYALTIYTKLRDNLYMQLSDPNMSCNSIADAVTKSFASFLPARQSLLREGPDPSYNERAA